MFHGLFVANLILETTLVFAAPPSTVHAQATLHESTAACLLVGGSSQSHPAHEKHRKCTDLPAEMKRVAPRETRYYANKESVGNGTSAGGNRANGNKGNEARSLLTVNILSGFMPTAKPVLTPMRGPLKQIDPLTHANDGFAHSPLTVPAFNGNRLYARMALG